MVLRIAIPIWKGFTALDAIGPYELLDRLPDATINLVSKQRGLYPTGGGVVQIQATATLNEIPSPDILVVPGGPIKYLPLQDEDFLNWIRKAHETSQYTTSVCTGSLLLGAAGLLDGIEATTHWLSYDKLSSYGAKPSAKRVIQQGKIITSAGVSSGIDMAIYLAALIRGEEVAKACQLMIEYDPQPPFDAGSVEKAGPVIVEKAKELRKARVLPDI